MTRYIALDASGLPKLVDNPELASHFVLAVGGPAAPHIEARPVKKARRKKKAQAAYTLSELLQSTIISVVAQHYGAKISDLKAGSRRARLCHARHVAAYLLRERGATWCEIGELLQRDHSTMISGVARIQDQLDADTKLSQELKALATAVRIAMRAEGRNAP